jgi:hypothetical protein
LPAKTFFGILEKGNLSEQKKIWREKINLAKKFFNLAKTIFSFIITISYYSPFCVPAKVSKLVGLTRPPFLSPTNLITFAGTQNGE